MARRYSSGRRITGAGAERLATASCRFAAAGPLSALRHQRLSGPGQPPRSAAVRRGRGDQDKKNPPGMSRTFFQTALTPTAASTIASTTRYLTQPLTRGRRLDSDHRVRRPVIFSSKVDGHVRRLV